MGWSYHVQVLAERERRLSAGDSAPPQSLAEEIRAAVNEANARVRKTAVLPSAGASSGTVAAGAGALPLPTGVWAPVSPLRDIPPSPSTISSGSVSPGGVTSDSSDVLSSERRLNSHFWHTSPITDWSKEQVT